MFLAYRRISFKAVLCLFGVTASGWANEFPCADEQCLPTPRSPRVAAAPTEEAPAERAIAAPAAAARGPVMFAAPTPNGEVEGAQNSYALPSIEFHFPKWQIGTPVCKIRGIGRGRREAQMKLDEGTAPIASGAPAIYGPLIGAGLQQRVASPASAPASAAPADAAPSDCVDPCAIKQQQEEVRQLTQQVQQLQGLLLQLSEQQASNKVDGEAEPEEPSSDLSYIPSKARTVSYQTSRSAKGKTYGRERERQLLQEEELAALEAETAVRQEELQEDYAQKAAELEEMQARMDKLQMEQKRMLEAKLRKIDSERERRIRSRISTPAIKQNQIVQSSSEYQSVDEEPAQISPPTRISRPLNGKPLPTSWRRAKHEVSGHSASDVGE